MKLLPNILNLKKLLTKPCSTVLVFLLFSPTAFSLTYNIPASGNTVGEYQQIIAKKGTTLYEVAEDFDIGVGEMLKANPGLSHKPFKQDTTVTIPAQFVLPSGPRNGIVLNLANKRLFYFHADGTEVNTYPVGIGREGWTTPLGSAAVVDKTVHPAWHPTPSIRREAESRGVTLPEVIPAGPNNPLGQYAMHLSLPSILIHGTNSPHSVGLQASHGCIRMYADDIEELFSLTTIGTSVHIVYEPHQAD
jgi:L,D-transpeptidase ErfK/SrfK